MISNETLLHDNKHWSLDQIEIVICKKTITLATFRGGRRHDNHHMYFGVQNCHTKCKYWKHFESYRWWMMHALNPFSGRNFSRNLQANYVPAHELVLSVFVHLCAL
jgi:hypothetical protein